MKKRIPKRIFLASILMLLCCYFIYNGFISPYRIIEMSTNEVYQCFNDYGIAMPTNGIFYAKHRMRFGDRSSSSSNVAFWCSESEFDAFITCLKKSEYVYIKEGFEAGVIWAQMYSFYGKDASLLTNTISISNIPVCYDATVGGRRLLLAFFSDGDRSCCFMVIQFI